ncbi:MAG: hypothetical protein JWQ87_164 [Candidatus Sulfotelmatobacter sp.]|nr:hypothetical protein [Candidatus Sulfotelmatobacter sp.]
MQIDQIVAQLRQERDRIEEAIRALSSLTGNTHFIKVKPQRTGTTLPKRTMSAAVRRKIGAAARARWAKIKAGKK